MDLLLISVEQPAHGGADCPTARLLSRLPDCCLDGVVISGSDDRTVKIWPLKSLPCLKFQELKHLEHQDAETYN